MVTEEKGQCERETERKLKKFITMHIAFDKLQREEDQKNQLLCQILLELAKRLDKEERRLILVENWTYKNGCDR